MRDALRTVWLVLGVPLVIAGGIAVARGRWNTAEIVAGVVGVVFLVLVAIIPPGQPPPPLYDDDW
jgi:hypothetical protein